MAINFEIYIKEVLGTKELGEISQAFLERMDDLKDLQSFRGQSTAINGKWNNRYNKEYARRKKGGRRSPVILRDKDRSIERTAVTNKGGGMKRLEFTDKHKARIFQLHQDGSAKGGKMRQIYPEQENEIPKEATKAAQIKLNEIVSRNG